MREPGVENSAYERGDELPARPPRDRLWRAIAFWGGATTLIFVLSIVSIAYVMPTLPVALWWPAAGVSAAFVLRARERQRPLAIALVLVITALGNLVAGRPIDISGLYGAANAMEVTLLSWLLMRGHDARLRTTNDAVRFVMWTAVSSVIFALTVALINVVLANGEPVSSALITGASHFSAVLLIVPLMLFDAQPQPRPAASEIVAQLIAMTVALAAGLGPLTELPLAFLVFVPLAWVTLRFPPRYAHVQALTVAVLTVLLTRLSVRIFTPTRISVIELAVTVAVFLAAVGIFTVISTTERNESLANARTALDSAEAGAEAARATTATLQVRYDLERQRQDFLSTTSHELRTPVTIIAGYSELLSDSGGLSAEGAAWVDAIHRNTSRLAGMLDDLLAFSRTEAEQPRPVEVAASELVATAVSRHIEAATARALTLTIAPIGELIVIADRDDAARALGNLISNAVKFTPDGGSIHIETTDVADDVMITVSDTGPGIGSDGLLQAFDLFYRGAQSEVRAMAGTGLGLPIARMLARRNDGEVMLVSLPGLGTKATLLLPRADASSEGGESAEGGQ
ncbi:MASE1 domain-containing protein [Microbacterium sp. VKM Ac-2870]|uniref:sensor histidine kinase n=1 Tax=Microbacterium sp. VKM Ac-2870 TaxID=2783825 RepID=UPI00188AC254|nr:HAMP domain-containing sensor histidine kinase [Microbacterium sp. VKM Ac-2870]MBF4561442.1 MASE1 domain-containing protein [Microbacterium sp. VKM Ac-2870]